MLNGLARIALVLVIFSFCPIVSAAGADRALLILKSDSYADTQATVAAPGVTIDADSLAMAPSYYDASLFVIGRVAVGVILPESTGNVENWQPRCQAEVFQNMRYAGASSFARAYTYVNDLRNTLHTDWCYTCVVVDSLNDPDRRFTSGCFYVHDGAMRKEDKTKIEVRVEGSSSVLVGDFVIVTGISGIYALAGLAASTPLIRLRDPNDVRKLRAPPAWHNPASEVLPSAGNPSRMMSKSSAAQGSSAMLSLSKREG